MPKPDPQIKKLEEKFKKYETRLEKIDKAITQDLMPSANQHHKELKKYIDESLAKLDKRVAELEKQIKTK